MRSKLIMLITKELHVARNSNIVKDQRTILSPIMANLLPNFSNNPGKFGDLDKKTNFICMVCF